MIVKIHPHRTKVVAGEEKCVSVTPKGGRAYYKAHVLIKNASFRIYQGGVERARREQRRNVHAWAVGRLCLESDTVENTFGVGPQWEQVTYHYNEGRFKTLSGIDVTDKAFDYAMCVGPKFYVRW